MMRRGGGEEGGEEGKEEEEEGEEEEGKEEEDVPVVYVDPVPQEDLRLLQQPAGIVELPGGRGGGGGRGDAR